METVKNQIALKMFAGFLINPEMRMHLQQSKLWKEAKLFQPAKSSLIEVHFDEKEYIGCYLQAPEITMHEIKKLDGTMKTEILALCPKLKVERLLLRFFSQPFIS